MRQEPEHDRFGNRFFEQQRPTSNDNGTHAQKESKPRDTANETRTNVINCGRDPGDECDNTKQLPRQHDDECTNTHTLRSKL